MDADHVPAAGKTSPFIADEIIIYGIHLNARTVPAIPQLFAELNIEDPLLLRVSVVRVPSTVLDEAQCSIVAAYGYAFEGQCYRLDKPRVLAFNFVKEGAAAGCGYDPLTYKMWRVRPANNVIELNVTVGMFEKVFLEANLPGKRAPNTYASNMRLAHRGGRLTSD
jgi:hypothetical protein